MNEARQAGAALRLAVERLGIQDDDDFPTAMRGRYERLGLAAFLAWLDGATPEDLYAERDQWRQQFVERQRPPRPGFWARVWSRE